MGVVMKGGTSGNRFDSLASSPGHDSQPIVDTANNGGVGPGVSFPSQNSGNREGPYEPNMPKGGENAITAGGDPGAKGTNAAPADIFKGCDYTPGL